MRRGAVAAAIGVLVLGVVPAAVAGAGSVPTGPDPVVSEWPAWPYLSQCGGLPFYAPAAFSEPPDAELGSLPSEVALREALQQGTIPFASGNYWRRIAEDEDEAEFVQGELSGEVYWLSLKREEGKWKFWGSSSDCAPTSILGRGPVVSWVLAESAATPDKAVRRIRIALSGGPCSGGRPQNPRARLVFRKWGRKLLMSVWLKPLPPGLYTCQGVREIPLRVTLPGKIKLSKLYDGSTYPPQPAL